MKDLISKEAYDELQAKLQFLKTDKRHQIAKAIGEAREHGDLKENSAYHEARKDQSLNEAKITELEARLSNAEIMKDEARPKGFVSLGSKVKFQNLETEDIREYIIVSDLEANIFEKKISCDTPMGSALLGAKKDEIVEVLAPVGLMKLKVLEII